MLRLDDLRERLQDIQLRESKNDTMSFVTSSLKMH